VYFITRTGDGRLGHRFGFHGSITGVVVCHSGLQCISSHVPEMGDWVIDLASSAALSAHKYKPPSSSPKVMSSPDELYIDVCVKFVDEFVDGHDHT